MCGNQQVSLFRVQLLLHLFAFALQPLGLRVHVADLADRDLIQFGIIAKPGKAENAANYGNRQQ